MTDKELLERINKYSEKVLKDIDPQTTKISVQLDKIRPVMEEIANETGMSLEDVFIKYMDLASTQKVEMNDKLKDTLNDAGVTNLGGLEFR
ncbi:MAG: hypothetical protein MJ133_05555 [Lachnospiraceae bacterium]|nr:hypothetical protein [Lachnospiraceae bacterium]